jgi:CheY-like chemotaxis protein/Tfp pilus assembly protein PilZ
MSERSKKILIVDDSETFLMYVAILLRRMGYDKIIPASNGLEALKLLRILMPDIVILDITMPQMDGVTVLRHIKGDEHTSKIPVIMASFKSDRKSHEECERLGCSGYITKPVRITELNDALNQFITYEGGKKRKFLRTTFEKKVVVTYNGIMNEHHAVSLSEGGIFIRTRDPFQVGAEIELSIPLSDEKNIHVKGIVIYIKGISGDIFRIPPGIALKFKDLTSDDSAQLHSCIKELLTGDIIAEQDEPVITMDR